MCLSGPAGLLRWRRILVGEDPIIGFGLIAAGVIVALAVELGIKATG